MTQVYNIDDLINKLVIDEESGEYLLTEKIGIFINKDQYYISVDGIRIRYEKDKIFDMIQSMITSELLITQNRHKKAISILDNAMYLLYGFSIK